MITVKNLSKQFTRHVVLDEDDNSKGKSLFNSNKAKKTKKEEFYAVDHISFEVNEGEIVGILGPNGAGKTTLLRMLGTLMEPSEGSVILTFDDDRIITDPIEMKQNIGYLSGNTKLFRRMSTREMLTMLGRVYGMKESEIEAKIQEICDVLDMSKFIDNYIERLSTGQTQRASIARCLIHSPKLYIFDEPTLGLDILSADAIVSFMKKQKQLGKTVLYSTHYLEEAEVLCDRILMIYQGKIVASGTVEEMLKDNNCDNLRAAFHNIMKNYDVDLAMDSETIMTKEDK